MWTKVVLIALLTTGCAGTAHAQQTCFPRQQIVKQLAARYGEHPVQGGLNATGQIAELFMSEDGATWTITMTSPAMLTCMILAGTYWDKAPQSGEDQ